MGKKLDRIGKYVLYLHAVVTKIDYAKCQNCSTANILCSKQ